MHNYLWIYLVEKRTAHIFFGFLVLAYFILKSREYYCVINTEKYGESFRILKTASATHNPVSLLIP